MLRHLQSRNCASRAAQLQRPALLFATNRLAKMTGTTNGMGVCTSAAANGAHADTTTYDYDLFTIGAGSGGTRASRMTSGHGKKVAICELPFDFVSSETLGGVGGTCVLRGCVPKKLMVYASEFADEFHNSIGFGWDERALPNHNWTTFMTAKRKELMRLNSAYKNTLANAKVELLEGRGRVVDAHTVDVDGKRYTARNILIAVGGRAQRPDIPGAELCITSDEILELPERPKKMTVIGGGYIGLEFSGIFQRFGTEVHTIFRQKLPLRGFDEEVRTFIAEQYKLTGLNLHPENSPTAFIKQADGRITVVYRGAATGDKDIEIKDNDCVLLATGRAANTKTLGLIEAGVKLGKRGEVIVDDYNCTNIPSIWALGDVIDKIQLTPVALMEGMALAKTLALGQPTKPDYFAVPSAVFSHPNLATVGLTEEAAILEFGDVDVYSTSFKAMKNTISGSPLRTLMKLVVDHKTDKVVGIHMVGDDAGDIMQGFAVAMKAGVTKAVLDTTIGVHPSSAEEFVTMRTVTRQLRSAAKAPIPELVKTH